MKKLFFFSLLIFCFILPCFAFSQNIAIISSISVDKEIDKIALAPNTGIAYGINKEEKRLYIFDLKNYAVKTSVRLDKNLRSIAVDSTSNLAYITAGGHGKNGLLYIVDNNGTIIKRIDIPKDPEGIAVNPNNKTIVISIEKGKKLSIFSSETLTLIKEILLPHRPELVSIDTETNRAVIIADKAGWFEKHDRLLIIDLNTNEILKDVRLKTDIDSIAIDINKDIAVAVSSDKIMLLDINTGSLISVVDTHRTHEVDINQSTHNAVVTEKDGFLLLDLNTNTMADYDLNSKHNPHHHHNNDLKLTSVAIDMFRNTALFGGKHSVIEVQLPNPVPEITQITPDKIQRSTESQTITIQGDKFITTTQAYLNTQALQTTFIDNNHLQATITKEQLQTAGTYPITATNPIPDGGTSNQVFIQITNPAPTIDTIDPQELTAGTTSQTLTITGTGFFEGMEVYLNGNKRNFTYIDSTKIQIELTQEELLAGGNLQIIIKNPGTGGQTEPINIPINNPVPELIGLYPEQATSVELMLNPDLTLLGSNLVVTSKVIFNNVEYPALYIDPNLITVFLPTEAIKTPGKYPVKITNPTPGGGESQTLEFTTQTPLNIKITSPNNGEIINKQTATIKGILTSTNKDIGITANGITAAITGNEWVATNIPLTTGTNTIEAIIKDNTGRASTDQININTQMTTNKIQLKTNTTSGISPLQINFTAQTEILEEQIIKYELDYEGDGFIDATGSIYDLTYDNINHTYTQEGNYNPTITILDDQGNTYTDTIAITVLSKTEVDTLLKSKWEAMKEALKNKDVDKALEFFAADSKETYKEILSALKDQLPQIVQEMQDIQLIYVKNNTAKYRIRKNEVYGGQTRTITYYIYFGIDTDGIWKIIRY